AGHALGTTWKTPGLGAVDPVHLRLRAVGRDEVGVSLVVIPAVRVAKPLALLASEQTRFDATERNIIGDFFALFGGASYTSPQGQRLHEDRAVRKSPAVAELDLGGVR